jgi:hypothetical protein
VFWLWFLWMTLAILVWIRKPYRWLRGHGLARHPAALLQALVLAGVWVAVWDSFAPSLRTPLDQLALMFTFTALVTYAGILLRVRSIRAA